MNSSCSHLHVIEKREDQFAGRHRVSSAIIIVKFNTRERDINALQSINKCVFQKSEGNIEHPGIAADRRHLADSRDKTASARRGVIPPVGDDSP
ncbi:hypothetical protein BL250_14915 [Erwinia sp. OLTSP20]|nr:hypothetical protein BV501_17695 [Erwinia sp. OAMSP11]PIJ68878.1 hypothetical protein BK416_15960 [Erwinia sp. OLSSP12]PIJ80098.1 hypothetical protein BLD46_16145 [Erwinia sp. OLMTSP26]PIJ81531.1 hypothetical protein BLD49_16340 [Erwinia sp. OLMDSP33]PIJ82699.1 hypothetical protein BLD47_06250 [Erwinia sp. OLCASP19]PIJ89905.1 hypothetical protein BL250_14915 [Erwinia sp. OLTSP20]PIJ89954.1 hypothetical protein BL249_14510 [Erwinia sp. OLFS4]